MPYDPMFGFGYPSYPGYPMPQAPRGNQPPVQQNTYAFVNGIEGAKSYILQPNQTVLLMDSERPVCYMKQSNGLGQSTLRYFKLVEVSESELKGETTTAATESKPNGVFISAEELESIKARISDLEKKAEGK